ncbi:MAG: hypothetical protein D6706_20070 [Chloroflexi bacterium]|nr:MAG: hypothetical protein D6706_20070 [Chloroflexota bacterium]
MEDNEKKAYHFKYNVEGQFVAVPEHLTVVANSSNEATKYILRHIQSAGRQVISIKLKRVTTVVIV